MDNFSQLRNQVRNRLLVCFIAAGGAGAGIVWFVVVRLELPILLAAGSVAATILFLTVLMAGVLADYALRPLRYLRDAILHVSPSHSGTAAPNLDTIRPGRELVTSLALEVYQMASQTSAKADSLHSKEVSQASQIVSHLPLPLFVFNKQQLVTNASDEGINYCGTTSEKLFGKPLYDNMDLEFPSEFTLESWIKDCQANKVTDTAYWERVRVRSKDDAGILHQCDMAAYYNRDNPSGTEFIITLFDRTKRYNRDDEALGFVALAVHELRTPLTILRGYIEVLEEELEGKANPELAGFMRKLQVSAAQLTVFVNNILNVARIEENQLVLKLSEENWKDVLEHTLDDLKLKAQITGKVLEVRIAPGLPSVAVDRVSIYEVISNLIDNAIKYSGDSTKIIVSSAIGKDGLVETTIQDFGVGIPESVMPNLFEKFYRNHRTRSQIGGTGLGLYLSKAIIGAHGGQIWAKSKEGEGSTFGFSLQPYSQLSDEMKRGDTGIVRNAHGWIKNHSLYRR